jgi:hypothetical protein
VKRLASPVLTVVAEGFGVRAASFRLAFDTKSSLADGVPYLEHRWIVNFIFDASSNLSPGSRRHKHSSRRYPLLPYRANNASNFLREKRRGYQLISA